jgi:hypothetical protein
MRSHIFSLHPSIWKIVESGMHFDSSDNPIFINEKIHKNAQATTILLASLCKDEYNKVSGLDNAKKIWDTLKISHEGNDATMTTKMKLVKGELGRFTMKRGVGQLFSNAMNQEQGNTIVNYNGPLPSEALPPHGCNAYQTKVKKDIPSSD